MKMKKTPIIILSLLLVFSCEKNNDTNPEVPQDIIDLSLSLFDGEVIEKESEQENGLDTWEVKIENENGSIVKFYWTKNGQILIKIEGQVGPFNYNIMPGNSLINFSTAQTVAKAAVKNESITKWKLQQDDNFIDKWVYSFEFDSNGGISIVIIDAKNGDILETS